MNRGSPKTEKESLVQVTLNVNTTTTEPPAGMLPVAGFGLVGTAVQEAGPVGVNVTSETRVAAASETLSEYGCATEPLL
jgi:hypothetical protein